MGVAAAVEPSVAGEIEPIRQQVHAQRLASPAAAPHGEEGKKNEVHERTPLTGTAATSSSASSASASTVTDVPECPICLDECKLPIETNCSHKYCCECILSYWQNGPSLMPQMLKCPCCRRQIDLLMPYPATDNWASETNLLADENARRWKARMHEYNERYSRNERSVRAHNTPHTNCFVFCVVHHADAFYCVCVSMCCPCVQYSDIARDTPVFINRFVTELSSGNVNTIGMLFKLRNIAVICFSLLYFILPFDVLPESLLGVAGYIDDLLLILFIIIYLSIVFRNMIVRREEEQAHRQAWQEVAQD